MEKAYQGDWIRVHSIILEPAARADQTPDDTKKVPLELWAKGWLEDKEVKMGEEATIKTVTGRILKGTMVSINPPFEHNFGQPIPELLEIGNELRQFLKGEGAN